MALFKCKLKHKEPVVEYYGTATSLDNARYSIASVTVGNYAMFAGGTASNGQFKYNTIDIYNLSLTHSVLTLSVAKYSMSAININNKALLCGGYIYPTSPYDVATVDVYDSSLTHSTATDLDSARGRMASINIGGYALIGGGRSSYYGSNKSTVNVYDSSLTHSTATDLSSTNGTGNVRATVVGNYALFGGGSVSNGSNPNNVIDTYNISLTHSTFNSNKAVQNVGILTINNYAIFAGGQYNTSSGGISISNVATVDVYDSSLTHSTATDLSSAKTWGTAYNYNANLTLKDLYALFVGGNDGNTNSIKVVETYNKSLVHSFATDLSVGRVASCTELGNYAICVGGSTKYNENVTNVVDVYTIS